MTRLVWWEHTARTSGLRSVVRHLYRSGAPYGTASRPVCGTSGFYRAQRPGRRNSRLPLCGKCVAYVAREGEVRDQEIAR